MISKGNLNNFSRLFLVNDQRDAKFLTMYLFLFLTLYMFRAHRAHHQERRIVSTQPLVTVSLCRWPYRVQVGSELTSSLLFLPLYMFRAHRAHNQERRIVPT
jgi:hypothetical protein